MLRSAADRDPYDRDLADLVGELSTQSSEFRARWVDHKVRVPDTGTKDLFHPVVGDLTLTYDRLELAGDPPIAAGIQIVVGGAHRRKESSHRSRRVALFTERTVPLPDALRRERVRELAGDLNGTFESEGAIGAPEAAHAEHRALVAVRKRRRDERSEDGV